MQLYDKNSTKNIRMTAPAIKKRVRDVSKLSVNSGDFGHNILSPKQL